MKSGISKDDNMLEMIPSINENTNWKKNDNGMITIIVPRDGSFDKIVRVFCKTPKETNIDLDKIGSIVWKAINGKNDIYEIAKILKSEFGEEIEPVYDRLLIHLNVLRNNKFIHLKKASY